MSDRPHDYWVYIMTSKSRVIYIGVTNSLEKRVWQHKTGMVEGFTKKYNCTRLVWFEHFRDVRDAIAYEKRLKGLLRAKKVALIETENPQWRDLSEELFEGAKTEGGGDSSLRSE
jgi:putative endonuclease